MPDYKKTWSRVIKISVKEYWFQLYFFFFQADDGIRDYKVTGVQTCALPISTTGPTGSSRSAGRAISTSRPWWAAATAAAAARSSSEERRVGKECRSRWS